MTAGSSPAATGRRSASNSGAPEVSTPSVSATVSPTPWARTGLVDRPVPFDPAASTLAPTTSPDPVPGGGGLVDRPSVPGAVDPVPGGGGLVDRPSVPGAVEPVP